MKFLDEPLYKKQVSGQMSRSADNRNVVGLFCFPDCAVYASAFSQVDGVFTGYFHFYQTERISTAFQNSAFTGISLCCFWFGFHVLGMGCYWSFRAVVVAGMGGSTK